MKDRLIYPSGLNNGMYLSQKMIIEFTKAFIIARYRTESIPDEVASLVKKTLKKNSWFVTFKGLDYIPWAIQYTYWLKDLNLVKIVFLALCISMMI